MITDHKAKSEYESNLALANAHSNNSRIFQYISSIIGNDRYIPLQFSTMISKFQLTQTKLSYSTNTVIQYTPPVNSR